VSRSAACHEPPEVAALLLESLPLESEGDEEVSEVEVVEVEVEVEEETWWSEA
jgi:hypothetical protein